jgi:hypothetical protein
VLLTELVVDLLDVRECVPVLLTLRLLLMLLLTLGATGAGLKEGPLS